MDVHQPTSEHGECLMFWYHMNGKDVGSLNIYVQELQNPRSRIPVWSASGDQGEHWRHGRATIISPHSPYKVRVDEFKGALNILNIALCLQCVIIWDLN